MFLPVLFFLAAQDWSAPARELARKISRADVITVTVRNSSTLSETELAEVRRAIESELRPRPRYEGSTVNVTLSETVQSYLWVAEILWGVGEREVVMVDIARPETPAPKQPLTIEKKQIWEQDKPILDVVAAGAQLIVLDPAAVSVYRERVLVSSMPITAPMPRDPRGRLEFSGDAFRALLPGAVCTGTFLAASMSCLVGAGLGLTPGRNYFADPSPYFSSAALADVRVVAGIDGNARVYDSSLRELGSIAGWGSDIAAVDSACGSGRQVIASKPTDGGEPDAIQAYEIAGARAAASGDPAQFSGPVTALWSRGSEATAVTRIAETGRYAAYSLSITCGR